VSDSDVKTILVVDDDCDTVELLKGNLTEQGYKAVGAFGGLEAMALARELAPSVVLLDVTMPGMDGLEVCRRLKADVATQHVPVLLLVDPDTTVDKMQGLSIGATDYLSKPIDEAELRARVTSAVRLGELTHRPLGPARYDELTGLLSRRCFEQELQRECNRSRRYDSLFALVVVDIDRFQAVNGEYGRATGDGVLKSVAILLREKTRESDYAARWESDRFVVLLPEADLPRAIGFTKKLHAALAEKEFRCGSDAVHLQTSMGVASMQNVGGRDPSDLLSVAWEALQAARSVGGGRIYYHTCGEQHAVRQ
jgi:diguanylate cyclase (GGDEF)-like protein